MRTVYLLLLVCVLLLTACGTSLFAEPTRTPEPIVPTPTATVPTRAPQGVAQPAVSPTTTPNPPATATPPPTATPLATATVVSATAAATPETTPETTPEAWLPDRERFGGTAYVNTAVRARAAGLPFAATLNWNVVPEPPQSDFTFWQMIRTGPNGIRRTNWDEIAATIDANPGSYWMVGNEPDVRWQDNVPPERYAEIYHEVYTFIKERDPSAQIVIGGVSQPTPLRRAYLDRVLDHYELTYDEPMPVDIWNVHAFTLREEANSWGVDIPPGMEGETGILYEIDDHDSIEIMRQNLHDFRAWMAERGYGDRPLVVSEYGILMPTDYGFPIERVANFMTASFDLFRTETADYGYAPDGNRLVQWWFWFSIQDPEQYPTGDLFDPTRGELTELGRAWVSYHATLP